MQVEQIDLFDLSMPAGPALNGVYYERETGLFVSYVLGQRHLEVSPRECIGDKAWKEKTKRERAL